MRAKYILLVPAILLLASCSYVPSVTDVSMQAGETTTITITEFDWFAGTVIPVGGVRVVSSDPSVLRIVQDPSLRSASVELHALQPGTAYIQSVDRSQRLVTVHVGSCLPVSTQPQITEVQALVGVPVELRVFTDNPNTVPLWNEDRGDNWVQIPFATGNVYAFTPRVSGTYRFLVRYAGYCADDSTLITVVASTRGRAARHL